MMTTEPELSAEGRKPVEDKKTLELRSFIHDGISLIKDREFQEAITFFQNRDLAKSLGIAYSDDPYSFILTREPTSEEIPEILRAWSVRTEFRSTFPSGGAPIMKLSQILAFDPINPDKKIDIPNSILHNVALGYAEEWMHVLQYLRGGKSDFVSITEYENSEIDVAVYFFREGVPLTPEFIENHSGRKGALSKLKV